MTRNIANDGQYQLLYDAENRVVEVKKDGATIAQFTYDGDGKRVKSVEGGVTILFVGGHYEVKGSEITKYYFAGATRIAMRKYTIPQNMTVEYILGDHLGSTSLTTDSTGTKTSEMRYNPWGEVRYTWTTSLSTTPAYQLTRYTYTGQYSYMDDPTTAGVTEGFGLMFYQARWYDPGLGRFAQADTIIPLQTQGVQAWDRYAYVNNNPVKYNDPTGHCASGWLGFACFVAKSALAGGIQKTISYAISSAASRKPMTLSGAVTSFTSGALGGASRAVETPYPVSQTTAYQVTTASHPISEMVGPTIELGRSTGLGDLNPLNTGPFDPDDWYLKVGEKRYETPKVDIPVIVVTPHYMEVVNTTTITSTTTTYDQYGNPMGSETEVASWSSRQLLEKKNGVWVPYNSTPRYNPALKPQIQ